MRHLLLAVLLACAGSSASADPVRYARFPALSPDGKLVAFSWRGDIWLASARGGIALRLTVHEAEDTRPIFSPDGKRLAFASNRHNNSDVYVLDLGQGGATGRAKRLTWHEGTDIPCAFTPDGAHVIFQTRRNRDWNRASWLYMAALDGGTPRRLTTARGEMAALSADGKTLVFTRGNCQLWRRGYRGSGAHELWAATLDGMPARRPTFRQLTRFAGNDDSPSIGWDGAVYYRSDRSGSTELWRVPPGGGAPRQVTRGSAKGWLSGPRAAGKSPWAVARRWDQLVRIDLRSGKETPIRLVAPGDGRLAPYELVRLGSRGASEYAISPDGKGLAIVAEGEVFVRALDSASPRMRRLTSTPAREHSITWRGNHTLAYISDRTGSDQVWQVASLARKPLWTPTPIKEIRWTDGPRHESPSFSPDGAALAYVRGRGDVVVRDLLATEAPAEKVVFRTDDFHTLEWSPDARWLAVGASDQDYNSEIYLVPAAGGEAVNVSSHPDYDWGARFSEDGRVLAWVSARGKDRGVCTLFLRRADHEMAADQRPALVKQLGKAMAARRKLRLKQNGVPPARAELSGGGRKTVAMSETAQLLDLQLLRFALSQRQRAVARRLHDRLRSARPEVPRVAKALDGLERALLRLEGKQPKTPAAEDPLAVVVDPEELWLRTQRVPIVGDESTVAISPDGRTLVIEGMQGSRRIIWRATRGSSTRELAGGLSRVRAMRYGPLGRKVYFLDGSGQLLTIDPASGKRGRVSYEARLRIDRQARRLQKFHEAWRHLAHDFYDGTFRGKDWNALRTRYASLIEVTRTEGEFSSVVRHLFGELNASHLGYYPPRSRTVEPTGELGIDFDQPADGEGLRVTRVIRRSPASAPGSELKVGDRILALDDRPLGPKENLWERLLDRVGDPLRVTVRRGDEELTVVLRPMNLGQDRHRRYAQWVANNRARVDARSKGRLGYVHILGMNWTSLEAFERDLYARAHGKEGLLIDVRYNGGGWTTDLLLVMLTTRSHAFTVGRGGDPGYPQGRRPFYTWRKPAATLCNYASFSNAEIFSHAFKTLRRGPLIGTPTYGGVISTSSRTLVDGSRIRMPFRGWYVGAPTPGGVKGAKDMEFHPATPDHIVPLTPADEVAGRTPQLDRGIDELLEVCDAKKR